MRRRVLSLLATLAAVSRAAAQQAGTFEVGMFPQVSYFDKTWSWSRAGPARARVWGTSSPTTSGSRPRPRGCRPRAPTPATSPTSRSGPGSRSTCRAGSTQLRVRRGIRAVALQARTTTCPMTGSPAARACASASGEVTAIRIDTLRRLHPVPRQRRERELQLGHPARPQLPAGPADGKVRDKDGDGVPDAVDECKNTPRATRWMPRAVPSRTATATACWTTWTSARTRPAGDKVDAKGCSLPKDADGDGVMDDVDQCKDTPAGDKVDAKGCSLPKDADGDGVHGRRRPVQGHAGRRQGGRQGLLAAQGRRRRRRDRRQGPLPAYAGRRQGGRGGLPGAVRAERRRA